MRGWPFLLVCVCATPVFAADPNLFQVWSYDRYNDGITANSNDLAGRLWVPPTPAPAGGYTLVTFLHGLGEVGSSDVQGDGVWNTAQVNSNINNLFAAAQSRGFILYAPQAWGAWGGDNYNMAANQMAKIMQTYEVNPSKVYLTGLSNGGRGTWEMGTSYDDVFAALVPICGQMESWNTGATIARPQALAQLPIWAVHARNDGTVDVNASTRTGVNLIRDVKGLDPIAFPDKNSYPADYYTNGKKEHDDGQLRYTEYESGGHGIWGTAYARSDLYDWMLGNTTNNPQHLQQGETLRFDLGANVPNGPDGEGKHWNSTNYGMGQTTGITRAFATTDEGRRTGITLEVTNTFQGDSTSQPAGLPEAGSDAWYVQGFGGADGVGQFLLRGLDPNLLYDIELFGSSTNAGTVRYTINGIDKELAFQNNLLNTVTFSDVFTSVDGTLLIDVRSTGATYAYLNWFTVTAAVPEPAGLALLLPGVLLAWRRRAA